PGANVLAVGIRDVQAVHAHHVHPVPYRSMRAGRMSLLFSAEESGTWRILCAELLIDALHQRCRVLARSHGESGAAGEMDEECGVVPIHSDYGCVSPVH